MLKGLAIGLSIAAPVGPIGVLCIRRGWALRRPGTPDRGVPDIPVYFRCADHCGHISEVAGFLAGGRETLSDGGSK
jgi:hypothetical protein